MSATDDIEPRSAALIARDVRAHDAELDGLHDGLVCQGSMLSTLLAEVHELRALVRHLLTGHTGAGSWADDLVAVQQRGRRHSITLDELESLDEPPRRYVGADPAKVYNVEHDIRARAHFTERDRLPFWDDPGARWG